jgi:hypothetical protein
MYDLLEKRLEMDNGSITVLDSRMTFVSCISLIIYEEQREFLLILQREHFLIQAYT